MSKRKIFVFLTGLVCLFQSCSQSVSSNELSQPIADQLFVEEDEPVQALEVENLKALPPAFTVAEYMSWVKEQRGVFYDKKENQDFMISILYKPLPLEAALSLSGDDLNEKALQKNIDIKKDYHYFLIEFLDKRASLSLKKEDRDMARRLLLENLIVLENNTYEIHEKIVEEFKGSLMGQPDNILLMVPVKKYLELSVSIAGEPFGLNKLRTNFKTTHIQSLPEIKI